MKPPGLNNKQIRPANSCKAKTTKP